MARAVAASAKPVFTGIGHTGDETVADVVAARVCITPTECGQHLVLAARRWWSDPRRRAGRAAWPAACPTFLADAQSRDAQARRHLTAAARHQLRVHRDRLSNRAIALGRSAPGAPRIVRGRPARPCDARLGPQATGHLGRQDERLHAWRRLLAAYDVERQLERGYSLTLTTDGSLVRGAAELAVQQEIVTRFADGTVRSRVERTTPADRADGTDGGDA